MTWFKVDDSFHSHPKVLAAEPAALGLWVVAGSWCGSNLTDGFVPDHVLQRLLPGAESLAGELVACGLWRRAKGGYRFHDWSVMQPTREEAMAARGKQASGGALGNHRRWHIGKGQRKPDCVYCQGQQPSGDRSVSDRVTEGGTESHPNPPVPSRPVPKGRGSVGESSSGSRRARETDDDDFEVEEQIIKLLHETTGRTVDHDHAATVRRLILTGRNPADPGRYVAAAIRGEPNRFLPATDPHGQAGADAITAVRTNNWDTAADTAASGAARARQLLGRKDKP